MGRTILSVFLLAATASACGDSPETIDPSRAFIWPLTEEASPAVLRLSPLPPTPPDPTNRVADDPNAAEFGRHLFHSTALSKDGDVSCATCHDILVRNIILTGSLVTVLVRLLL